MEVLAEKVLIAVIIAVMAADKLYFKLRFPECKNCGWLTKKNGRCCGCNSVRKYRWQ